MIGTSRTPDAIRGHVGAHCYQAPVTRIGCAPLSALRLQAGQAHVTQIPERRPICSGMGTENRPTLERCRRRDGSPLSGVASQFRFVPCVRCCLLHPVNTSLRYAADFAGLPVIW